MRATHGAYVDLFKQLLDGRGFMFETYPVLDGVLPASVTDADGWLNTGSKFETYEGFVMLLTRPGCKHSNLS